MSITEDAPAPAAERPSPTLDRPRAPRRAGPWTWLVAASALVLAGAAAVLGAWWIASSETRIATYRVLGTLSAIDLDIDAAAVEIVGGSRAVEVRRTDTFAFGVRPRERRSVSGGVLRIRSRCADAVLGACRSAYRIAVPDNVPLTVRASSGRIAVADLNGSAHLVTGSGAVAVTGFCGFSLRVTSTSGDVRTAADCSPDRIELRSGSGNVRARVPGGSYGIEAHSDRGTARVLGLATAEDAPFHIQALSVSGDVLVERGR